MDKDFIKQLIYWIVRAVFSLALLAVAVFVVYKFYSFIINSDLPDWWKWVILK